MAKAKKKEALTPEERLQAALVPDWEQPYKVPQNWCWAYLTKGAAECLDSFRKPINASERANREGDIPYYGATGQVGWIDNFLTNEQLVLVGEDGAPFLDLIKDKAYIIEGKAWVNNHAHILRSRFGSTGNSFLMHYLNIFNYHGFVNGTTRLKLTQGSMDIMPVPIPPLPEQQRIVDRIESLFAKLDEAKQKAQDALDSFETRKAAILHKAFTGELTAQWRKEHGVGMESWSWMPLKKCGSWHGGGTPSMSHPEYWENGTLLWVTSKDMKSDLIEDTLMHTNMLGVENSSANYIAEPAVLFVMRSGILRRTFPVCIVKKSFTVNQDLKALVPTDDISLEYLFWVCKANERKILEKCMKSGTTVESINATALRDFEIPIAGDNEQTEIVRILDDLLAKEQQAKEAAEAVLEQIDLVKKSILARAFRGELGTNDPAEESAVELVKDIIS